MLIFICGIPLFFTRNSNTIEINSNNCKQFSVVKLRKDKTN